MNCRRCKKKKATVKLAYCGESLCDDCFTEAFEKRVRRTIRTNRLLEESDSIAVALSGGKDSATILSILAGLPRPPGARIEALTIDLGIRGFGRKGVDSAKKLCRTLGIKHHIYTLKDECGATMDEIVRFSRTIPDLPPACSFCGVLRRRLMNEKAKELGFSKIAVGHNLDDEVQSGLMNYIRADYDRMTRMGALVGFVRDPRFVPRIKPLRDTPEEEVLQYAQIKGLEYAPVRCPYSKDAFRQSVKTAIAGLEKKHPGTRFQMLKSTDELVAMLRERTNETEMGACKICGEPTSGEKCKYCEMREKLG